MSMYPQTAVISIHALAKRATVRVTSNAQRNTNFNPRPRKEGDYRSYLYRALRALFQSTPSQRGRLASVIGVSAKTVISIHALAKRATEVSKINGILTLISIHALAKRATLLLYLHFCLLPLFQSTPSQRGRPQIYTMIIYILKLNITFRTFFLYKIIKN